MGRRADVLASLAGSWKGIDDERAADLYRRALDLDHGDPYALGNIIELEVVRSGSIDVVAAMGSSIAEAAARSRGQVERGENQPWASFDLAKFSLLAGRGHDAFLAACLAAARSSAAFMIETSARSLERFADADGTLDGLAHVRSVYRLGLESRFGSATGHEPDPALRPPIVVIAGGSSLEVEADMRRSGALVLEAMGGRAGTLVSGATMQGASAIAGEVAERNEAIRAVGYLPATVPADVEVDVERYTEIRRTAGEGFSVAEPLRYWADIIAAEISPAEVRVLAIGGGRISEAEYRMALAFGARVGAISGSGGAASALLRDPRWASTARLIEIAPNADAISGFLADA